MSNFFAPPEIAKNYIGIGEKKAKQNPVKAFVLALYAGFFIGSGGLISTAVKIGNVGLQGYSQFLGAACFPVGLTLVLVAGAELFTGNCLLIIPLLEGKINIAEMLISWIIVWLGNLAGSIIFAVLCVYGGVGNLFDNALGAAMYSTAKGKTALRFGDALVKGILCNTFVCLSVWMSFGAKDIASKILALWGPILLFVCCGMEHSIANMYFIPAGLFASYKYDIERENCDWGRMFYKNLLPVTLGNIIGGSIFVGLGYWFCYLSNFGKAPTPPPAHLPTEASAYNPSQTENKLLPGAVFDVGYNSTMPNNIYQNK